MLTELGEKQMNRKNFNKELENTYKKLVRIAGYNK